MLITNIIWETDNNDVILPTEVEVPDNLSDEQIADYLSNKYEFLVDSFAMPMMKPILTFDKNYFKREELDKLSDNELLKECFDSYGNAHIFTDDNKYNNALNNGIINEDDYKYSIDLSVK